MRLYRPKRSTLAVGALVGLMGVFTQWQTLALTEGSSMSRCVLGPGETLTYRVRFGFVETARVTVEVGQNRDPESRDIWPITVDARTTRLVGRLYDLDSQFVTQYVPAEGRSLGFERDTREKDGLRVTRVKLDPNRGRAEVIREEPDGSLERRTYSTGPASHDIASALFWLRGRPLAQGDVETVRIFTGRQAWDLVATVVRQEQVRTSAGRVDAKLVRLQTLFEGGAAAKRDIEVWMTNNAYHVPVVIRADLAIGSLRAELLDYVPPSGPSSR